MTKTTDTPANTLYEARVMNDVEIVQSVIDALTVGDTVSTTISELELWNGDEAFESIVAQGGMDGRPIMIKIVPVSARAASDLGSSLALATNVWDGLVTRIDNQGLRVRIAINDLSGRLDTLLVNETYDGLGGTGGISELKGLHKPTTIGYCFNIQPVYVGLVDLGDGSLPTYQSHHNSVLSHDAVRIRGVEQVLTGGVPGIGEFKDYASQGLFQIGGAADGQVNADVRGENTTGYKSNFADIIRWMLLEAGPAFSNSDLDAQSWFDSSPCFMAQAGYHHGTDKITTRAALNRVLSALGGGFLYGTRTAKLGIGLVGSPNASARATFDLAKIIDVKPVQIPTTLSPTPQTVQVRAAVNWHIVDDTAGIVDANEAARFNSPGPLARSFSNQIAARSVLVKELQIEGLFRYEADALARAVEIREWLERGLKVYELTTDRYLGVIELGMTVSITYPYYGLSGGWSGIVVAWKEAIAGRRLTLTVIG
jgi:hypothetical protein